MANSTSSRKSSSTPRQGRARDVAAVPSYPTDAASVALYHMLREYQRRQESFIRMNTKIAESLCDLDMVADRTTMMIADAAMLRVLQEFITVAWLSVARGSEVDIGATRASVIEAIVSDARAPRFQNTYAVERARALAKVLDIVERAQSGALVAC